LTQAPFALSLEGGKARIPLMQKGGLLAARDGGKKEEGGDRSFILSGASDFGQTERSSAAIAAVRREKAPKGLHPQRRGGVESRGT